MEQVDQKKKKNGLDLGLSPPSVLSRQIVNITVEIKALSLKKAFVYYVREDLQYNLDAFLLSTGLTLECPKCRPDEADKVDSDTRISTATNFADSSSP